MKNHTLMQTIARANRVFEGKVNGLIVDYIGVFRNLQRALAIYGSGSGGGVGEGDTPVQPKEVQLEDLRAAIAEARKLAEARGVDLESPKNKPLFVRLTFIAAGAEKLLHPADVKKTFLQMTDRVDRLYRAIGLDDRKKVFAPDWGVLTDLAARLRSLQQPVDISNVMDAVEKLLDESLAAQPFESRQVPGAPYGGRVHLGGIDFGALARFFAQTKLKASTAEVTAAAARRRVETLVRLNPTRRDLRDQLEALIEDYNEGAHNAERFFADLIAFMKDKVEPEERRTSAEGLTPEQLALHDLLLVDTVKIGAQERDVVKKIARELPKKLAPKLVIDWRKTQHARAAVKAAIRDELDDLPEAYDPDTYTKLVEAVYEHVYESYWGEGKSKYAEPAAP